MKQIQNVDHQLIQQLQHQQVALIASEFAFLSSFDFDVDELVAAGWTIELIDRILPILTTMKKQIEDANLNDADGVEMRK